MSAASGLADSTDSPASAGGSVDRGDRRLLIAIRVIALIGLSAASYLTYIKLLDIEPICATGGCDVVLGGRWAEVFGVPVVLIGVITYLLLIGSTFVKGERGRFAGTLFAFIGATFSVFLQYQSIVVVEHFCPWCFTSACCMITLAGLTAWRFVRS